MSPTHAPSPNAAFTKLAGAFVAVTAAIGCHSNGEQFESVCQITGKTIVEQDESGAPLLLDLQLEWDPCPGDQVQVLRGGAAFAKCMAGFSRGDFVPVKVVHLWDTRGYYTWDLVDVGGCSRPVEEDTPGSFEKSQECRTIASHGFSDGFVCNRRPFRQLVDVCPWMAR